MSAQAERLLTQRWAQTAHGSVTNLGNTAVTCKATDNGCAALQAGTINDAAGPVNRVWTDVDAISTTFNSSSAALSLPAGATVLRAHIYWGGDVTSGDQGVPAPNPANRNSILINAPGVSGYQTIASGWADDLGTSTFSAGADVTALVAARGTGAYTVANVQTGTGSGAAGGWSLVVAYQLASAPARRLQLLDGLSYISPPGRPFQDIVVSDFLTPASGPVTGRMVMVGGDGTRGEADSLTLAGTQVSGNGSPSDTLNSSAPAGRNPSYQNLTGLEVEDLPIDGILGASVSTATVRLASTSDDFYVVALGLATDESAPQSTTSPTATGEARDGATLTGTRGTWRSTTTVNYADRWRRCDAAGTNCADIPGATGNTLTLGPADVGSTIRVRTVATNAAGETTADSTATAVVVAAPPAATAPPTISGISRDGQTLTADRGTWTGTPTISYTYQWRRCDTTGGACSDIAGATASTHSLTPADVGAQIRVVVTASNAGGSVPATSAASGTVLAAPPANTSPPSISGIERDGKTLLANRGTWTGTPTVFYADQWQRCDAAGENCANIDGATDPMYTLTAADVNRTVRVVVTANNAAGPVSAPSEATGAIAPDPPVATTNPSISGTPQDTEVLSGDDGQWSGSPTIAYARRWQRCDSSGSACAPISGATQTTYTLTTSDVGSTIRFEVTASNGAEPVSKASAATSKVLAELPANTQAPSISGTERDGQTLSADQGTWTGTPTVSYAYQWQRCDSDGNGCTDIDGETATSLELTPADVGTRIRVLVEATNARGTVPATSAPSALVAAEPVANTSPPVISGVTTDGRTLLANRGTWTGTPTLSYTNQWQRCDAAGENCANIDGATDPMYTLTAADVNRTVRVVITASNAAGPVSATSDATGTITAAPPVATTRPSISGTPQDTKVLSGDDGQWSGTPTISYARQWQRCDSSGSACAPISGTTQATYTLTPSDVGSTIRFEVTASNGAGPVSELSATTSKILAKLPANTQAPSVSGTTGDTQTLSADQGTWTGTPTIAYAYQWQRCDRSGANCDDISGATDREHVLQQADVGSTLRVRVAATNARGSAERTSAASGVIAADPPAKTAAPTVSGIERDGKTLTADRGSWSGTPTIGYAAQWQRCDADGLSCDDIAGATSFERRLTPADVGATLRVVVTASNAGGPVTAASAVSKVVAPAAPVATTAPSLSGTERDGQKLTAARGTWSGTPTLSYDHRWERCAADGSSCNDIPGATATTYALTPADVGRTLRVRVIATNGAGSVAARSARSGTIAGDSPAATTDPSISGTTRDTQTLTADNGAWSGTPGMTFMYQWRRCDAGGDNCRDIEGAQQRDYTLAPADVDARLRVAVAAENSGGSATATSAPTTLITADRAAPGSTPPSITGTAVQGGTLTAHKGTWTGTPELSFTYQWRRCDATGDRCVDVSGATAATYTPVAGDIGAALRVAVRATNAAGGELARSAATDAVQPATPINTSRPRITVERSFGGHFLVADQGEWTGAQPMTFSYAWQRCEAGGSVCVDIPQATHRRYWVPEQDTDSRLRVVITALNSSGDAEAGSRVNGPVETAPATTPDPPRELEPVAPERGPGPAPAPAPVVPTDAPLSAEVPVTPAPVAPTVVPAAATDINGLPGSLISAEACQTLSSGAGIARTDFPESGAVHLRIRADGMVTPAAPVIVRLSARRLSRLNVRIALDGRVLKPVTTAKEQRVLLSPAILRGVGKHRLTVELRRPDGSGRRLTLPVDTGPCRSRFTTTLYKTKTGTALRLRVDSQRAISDVRFDVPAALALRGETKARFAGRLRIVAVGDRSRTLPLQLPTRATTGTLLKRTDGLTVRYTPTGLRISGLPARVGITELTVYGTTASRKAVGKFHRFAAHPTTR